MRRTACPGPDSMDSASLAASGRSDITARA